ncbi:uncharacterized protein METZ01_LOCUS387129, partial [marine metagenome]
VRYTWHVVVKVLTRYSVPFSVAFTA